MRFGAVVLLFLISAAAAACPPCKPAQCKNYACPMDHPFVCVEGPARSGCSPTPWDSPDACTECCDFSACAKDCTKKCSEETCNLRKCGADVPFVCTDGDAAGGCGKEDTWKFSPRCDDCCNLRLCTIPTDTPEPKSCRVPCGKELCSDATRCPAQHPFMCTKGTLNRACSSDAGQWANDPGCAACCDTTTCLYPCTICTAEECQQAQCSSLAPYVCTSGPSKGGCATKDDFWPSRPTCSSCCNVQQCLRA